MGQNINPKAAGTEHILDGHIKDGRVKIEVIEIKIVGSLKRAYVAICEIDKEFIGRTDEYKGKDEAYATMYNALLNYIENNDGSLPDKLPGM